MAIVLYSITLTAIYMLTSTLLAKSRFNINKLESSVQSIKDYPIHRIFDKDVMFAFVLAGNARSQAAYLETQWNISLTTYNPNPGTENFGTHTVDIPIVP